MSRDLEEERHRLEAFVDARGGRAYVSVPVSGPRLGWGSDSPTHFADAVWIDDGDSGSVIDWSDDVTVEFNDLLASLPAVLVSPRGYADRTAFGMLIACRELLSRAYPAHQLLRAAALSDKLSRRSIAYFAEGIGVIRADGTKPDPPGRRGPFRSARRQPPSAEDLLLARYYDETLAKRGTMWHEVPVSDAALDGLYVGDLRGSIDWWSPTSKDALREIVARHDVTVVEVKRKMNTDVIGQAIAGAIVLAHEVPEHQRIDQAVVVGGHPDPGLDWVCHKRGISVTRFST